MRRRWVGAGGGAIVAVAGAGGALVAGADADSDDVGAAGGAAGVAGDADDVNVAHPGHSAGDESVSERAGDCDSCRGEHAPKLSCCCAAS